MRLQSLALRGLGVFALLLVYSIVFGRHGLQQYHGMRQTLARRSHEAGQRLEQNRALVERLESLRTDKRELEELARSKLGVVGKDELVYVFPRSR